ncbi:MAG: biopolymer transporter ExbD [Candidatus Omnitrophica bacterium]|nr:biopolymer transporter ExbD [Candidatus Omnitrophota bacterium]
MKLEAHRAPLADINVTPFVDVMLVLLIIFMVAAPLLDQGIKVNLPRASTSRRVPGSGVMITLTKEHVVYFNRDAVTLKDLRQQLAGLSHEQPLLIRADRSAYVSRLVELWDLCRDVGFQEIRIATLTD